MGKKILCIFCLFMLCGCGTTKEIIEEIKEADETYEEVNEFTNYNLAKKLVFNYARSIELAYTEYVYNSVIDEYKVTDGIKINVDGKEIIIKSYGYEDVSCLTHELNNNKLFLDDCVVFGYTFKYEDGVVIEK